jgi:DNA polymerase
VTSWQELRDEAARCTRCDLYRRATQTVFGEGPASAAIALVGEQPGDQEDKQGHPFVGPAGRVLDRAYAGLVGDLVMAREAAAAAAR